MKGGRGGERKRGMGVGWGREGSVEEEILLSFTQPPSLRRLSSGVRYNKVGRRRSPRSNSSPLSPSRVIRWKLVERQGRYGNKKKVFP